MQSPTVILHSKTIFFFLHQNAKLGGHVHLKATKPANTVLKNHPNYHRNNKCSDEKIFFKSRESLIKCSLFLHRSKSFINSFNVFFSLSNSPWLCEVDKLEQSYICKKKKSLNMSWNILYTHHCPTQPYHLWYGCHMYTSARRYEGLSLQNKWDAHKKRFQLYSVSNALSIIGVCYLTRRPCGKSSFLQTALLWEASSEQS